MVSQERVGCVETEVENSVVIPCTAVLSMSMLLIRRRFSRAFHAGLLGALLGMVLISTEAVFALSLGGLAFEGPLAHLLDMEKVAAFMVGSLCFVVGFLFAWSPQQIAAIVGGLTAFWMLHIYGRCPCSND